jgi:hypothetical protein
VPNGHTAHQCFCYILVNIGDTGIFYGKTVSIIQYIRLQKEKNTSLKSIFVFPQLNSLYIVKIKGRFSSQMEKNVTWQKDIEC